MKTLSLLLVCLCGMLSAQQLPDGAYTLTSLQSGLALTDPSQPTMPMPGTQLVQQPANQAAWQQWEFNYDAAQQAYLIKNAILDVYLSDALNHTLTQEYQDTPAHQYWSLIVVPNGYVLHNKDTGRVIDDPGRSMSPGTGIITWPRNNGLNQSWAIAPIGSAPPPPSIGSRLLYAVNESGTRGSISVYDIDNGHRKLRTISTVSGISDVKGVVANAVTGKLYVSYLSGTTGKIFALDIYTDKILWNQTITPGVDRLAISPDGQLLYVPTWEDQNCNYMQVLDANSGGLVKRVYFSSHSHDTQYPLSGPIFQETKAKDGTGRYLYMIDPSNYAVSKVGPFHDFLGPYAVDAMSKYAVADVNGVLGFQVVDLQSNTIATAKLPYSISNASLPHGIGWTPDQSEVWQNTTGSDPHIYIWNMLDPMHPVFKERLNLDNGGSHWITFDIKGDYAYVAPNKNSGNGTDIFSVGTHALAGKIASSEDLLEVDFSSGKITQVGDQYGIGR